MNGTIHATLHKDKIFSLCFTKYLTYWKIRNEATETALYIFFLPPQFMCDSVKKEEAGGARSWSCSQEE
jgi:hypothetical protein